MRISNPMVSTVIFRISFNAIVSNKWSYDYGFCFPVILIIIIASQKNKAIPKNSLYAKISNGVILFEMEFFYSNPSLNIYGDIFILYPKYILIFK